MAVLATLDTIHADNVSILAALGTLHNDLVALNQTVQLVNLQAHTDALAAHADAVATKTSVDGLRADVATLGAVVHGDLAALNKATRPSW